MLALERSTAGTIVHVTTPVPQLFRCIPCGAAEEQGEARLAYFLQHLLLPLTGCTLGQKKYQDLAQRAAMVEEATSSLARAGPAVTALGEYAAQGRTLLFVASYFEFIRLRNALQAEAPNRFLSCSECVDPLRPSPFPTNPHNAAPRPRSAAQVHIQIRRHPGAPPVRPGGGAAARGHRALPLLQEVPHSRRPPCPILRLASPRKRLPALLEPAGGGPGTGMQRLPLPTRALAPPG